MLHSICPTAQHLPPRKITTFPLQDTTSSIGGRICIIREPAHLPTKLMFASITAPRNIKCSMSTTSVSFSMTDQLILIPSRANSSPTPIHHRKRNSLPTQSPANYLPERDFSICQKNLIKHGQFGG